MPQVSMGASSGNLNVDQLRNQLVQQQQQIMQQQDARLMLERKVCWIIEKPYFFSSHFSNILYLGFYLSCSGEGEDPAGHGRQEQRPGTRGSAWGRLCLVIVRIVLDWKGFFFPFPWPLDVLATHGLEHEPRQPPGAPPVHEWGEREVHGQDHWSRGQALPGQKLVWTGWPSLGPYVVLTLQVEQYYRQQQQTQAQELYNVQQHNHQLQVAWVYLHSVADILCWRSLFRRTQPKPPQPSSKSTTSSIRCDDLWYTICLIKALFDMYAWLRPSLIYMLG